MKSVLLCCSAMLACSVIACAPAKVENTGASPVKSDIASVPAKVEVTVAPPVKAAIDKATPAAKYVYYVVKGTEPKTDADLEKRTLFVCCNIALNDVLPIAKVAIPSLQAPQFAGVQAYVLSNFFNPKIKPDENCIGYEMDSFPLMYKGHKLPFTGKELGICRGVSEAQIRQRAIKDMQVAGNGVLLLSRDSQAPAPDFVEVVFK